MLLALAGVIAELAGPFSYGWLTLALRRPDPNLTLTPGPPLWLAGGVAARLGVLLVGGMHAFIILANPLGGIGEAPVVLR